MPVFNFGTSTASNEAELIWTNSDTTVSSASYDITNSELTHPMTEYNSVMISFKSSTSIECYSINIFIKQTAGDTNIQSANNTNPSQNYYYKRSVQVYDTGIVMGNGYRSGTAGGQYCIPYKIYGIREVSL